MSLLNAHLTAPGLVLFLLGSTLCSVVAAEPRAKPPFKDLNTPRDFPAITARHQWQERAKEIREQILVSTGLWPLPEKVALNPVIFGRLERDGYSVEKVYIRTAPNFYLAGNLYRPLGKGNGPFPAILNPHGHWSKGRLEDTADCSVPARCISFARQGMIAFSYDMVGYNDTRFADTPATDDLYKGHRLFGAAQTDLLWNVSLMGLQTWNSLRALDFIASLPGVDAKRIACTGASGGGTQTFMLGAIDDRLAAQAPMVMVSHIMQGGCSCENAPGLRVEYSNMEIAAAAAPRPQIIVGATGDWTRHVLVMEGPSIAHIYELFHASERFYFTRFDFGHNYNKTTREAVYQFLGKWLSRGGEPAALKEQVCQKEADSDLRVFPEGKAPQGSATMQQVNEWLRQTHRNAWDALLPKDRAGLAKFRSVMGPAWRHVLQVEWPHSRPRVDAKNLRNGTIRENGLAFTTATLDIRRAGTGPPIGITYWAPTNILSASQPKLVVLCGQETPQATAPLNSTNPVAQPLTSRRFALTNTPTSLVQKLLAQGVASLVVDHFSMPEAPDQFADFYSTYNRTKLQNNVRDLLTVCAGASMIDPRGKIPFRVILAGTGQAGLWALLASQAADAVVADAAGLDASDEQQLLGANVFCSGLQTIGGFQGGAMLGAPHPLLLHNTGQNFPTSGISAAYNAAGGAGKLQTHASALSEDEIVNWAALRPN
jgi:hypothetical protein